MSVGWGRMLKDKKVLMVEPTPASQSLSLTQQQKRTVQMNPWDGQITRGPRYKDMHDIRRFFASSVQRSHTVIREVVKLLDRELQQRLGNSEPSEPNSESDNILSPFSPDDLHKQFVVVSSEVEMVALMRRGLEANEDPFDIIISPFGCDQNSLPQHIVKLLGVDEEEDAELPKRFPKRVSNFSSPAGTPTAPTSPMVSSGFRNAWNFGARDEEKERRLLERGQHMCRRVTSALQREMSHALTSSSSSSADLDFVSASAPVIVYSLEAHVLDVPTRRKLAFKYFLRCASFVFVMSNVSR